MILTGFALALFQETQQPATPQAQFDAWFASLPKEHPRPLTQTYSWRVSISLDGAEDEEAEQFGAFFKDMQCEGEINLAIADLDRFKIEVVAKVRLAVDEEEIFDLKGRFGLAAGDQRLRAYAVLDEGSTGGEQRAGVEFPRADAELLYGLVRNSLPAIMSAAEAPPAVMQFFELGWNGLPSLADYLHPRGYTFHSLSTSAVSSFHRDGNRITLELAPDRELMEAAIAMETESGGEDALPAEAIGPVLDSVRLILTADAVTGLPLGGLAHIDFPLEAFGMAESGTVRMRLEINSPGFARTEPAAAELAAPEGIAWIDGKPFIALAMTQIQRLLNKAFAAKHEDF